LSSCLARMARLGREPPSHPIAATAPWLKTALPPRKPCRGVGTKGVRHDVAEALYGVGTACGVGRAKVLVPCRAAMTSATRRALAMMVRVGFTALLETKKLESAT
jgi:hypothetical protein